MSEPGDFAGTLHGRPVARREASLWAAMCAAPSMLLYARYTALLTEMRLSGDMGHTDYITMRDWADNQIKDLT